MKGVTIRVESVYDEKKPHKTSHVKSVHEEKKPYRCSICEYSSIQKQKMKIHVESVHEGKKPHKCSICSFSFSQKGSLERHLKSVHEGKKTHKCCFCDYSCSSNSGLTSHVKSVHEESPNGLHGRMGPGDRNHGVQVNQPPTFPPQRRTIHTGTYVRKPDSCTAPVIRILIFQRVGLGSRFYLESDPDLDNLTSGPQPC